MMMATTPRPLFGLKQLSGVFGRDEDGVPRNELELAPPGVPLPPLGVPLSPPGVPPPQPPRPSSNLLAVRPTIRRHAWTVGTRTTRIRANTPLLGGFQCSKCINSSSVMRLPLMPAFLQLRRRVYEPKTFAAGHVQKSKHHVSFVCDREVEEIATRGILRRETGE